MQSPCQRHHPVALTLHGSSMTSSFDIQLAAPNDHTTWLHFWQAYQAFYQVTIPEATTAQTWQRLMDAAEPMYCALAWKDGQPVGMVHYIFHRSTWTTGDYCYLQDLFIAPAMRGQQAGRALIEHVYAAATAHGASRVHWLTHESNTQAMQLYDRMAQRPGFVQYRHLLD